MNWNRIKEASPKAVNLLRNTAHYDLREPRRLYDFFDENEIYININPDYYGSSEYHPRDYESPSDIYFWININWVYEADVEYKTRGEAEEAAFTKAFEMLEEKLNK